MITEPHQKDIAEGFGAIPIQILLIVIAAPISEEVCFRGMLFGGLREKLPRIAAALVCGLIFGALHALTGVTAVPPLIVFGFLLALLYERTGSIVPGILPAHAEQLGRALLRASRISPVIRRLVLLVGVAALSWRCPLPRSPRPQGRRDRQKPQGRRNGEADEAEKPETPEATVTVEATGLQGGKAHDPRHGAGQRHGQALRRPASTSKSPSTSTASKLVSPQRRRQQGGGRSRDLRSRASIVREERQVRGQPPSTRRPPRSAATAPSARAGRSASRS